MLNILHFLDVLKYSLGCNEINLQFLVYYNDYRLEILLSSSTTISLALALVIDRFVLF